MWSVRHLANRASHLIAQGRICDAHDAALCVANLVGRDQRHALRNAPKLHRAVVGAAGNLLHAKQSQTTLAACQSRARDKSRWKWSSRGLSASYVSNGGNLIGDIAYSMPPKDPTAMAALTR
eukprot:366163-Chlamydomonas_euryale.AAC.6